MDVLSLPIYRRPHCPVVEKCMYKKWELSTNVVGNLFSSKRTFGGDSEPRWYNQTHLSIGADMIKHPLFHSFSQQPLYDRPWTYTNGSTVSFGAHHFSAIARGNDRRVGVSRGADSQIDDRFGQSTPLLRQSTQRYSSSRVDRDCRGEGHCKHG